jgi:hypothetical protein
MTDCIDPHLPSSTAVSAVAIFDVYVTDKSRLAESLAESGQFFFLGCCSGSGRCCARATTGHAATLPSPAMNSRRRIGYPLFPDLGEPIAIGGAGDWKWCKQY